MNSLPRVIQFVIIFAALFGVPFLYEVRPVLPSDVFYSVAFGEALFVVDAALTFIRPRASYYLGLLLAAVAFAATVTQPAHYQLVASGDVSAAATIFVGLAAEMTLMVLVPWYLVSSRAKSPGADADPARS
ncbi:MAG: hypothetical protein JRN34_03680 [Nitrososphaerota archaeon]|jgi:hypothetical protein|nr:hypothetical protein [Nitrososphaerota archaeon]MDG6942006.1 hypothetical protein [Nitrososphaerota archaeon]MDG6942471.1 hypothetical protein [Nitrososphaerota archaeon]MDG6948258.1 hypothetical protein [Nitrososphaerota archaeon]